MRILIEDKEETKLQMAPMIDMVFLLVIFFMCASHLSSLKNVELTIPAASRGIVPKERPERWTVNVLRDGSILSGSYPVDVEGLTLMVRDRLRADPNLKVYLRADAFARHADVRRAMGAMAKAGVDEIIFGVYAVDGEGGAP